MKWIKAMFIAAAMAIGLAACGTSSDIAVGTSYNDAPAASSTTCFTEPDAAQRQQLEQYAQANGDALGKPASDDSVCVIDGNGNMRYERQSDGASNFMFYWLMSQMAFGRGASTGLLTYGMLSGELSASEAITLSLLAGVGNDGRVYYPYSHEGGQWVQRTRTTNTVVNNVYYGTASKPVSFKEAQKTPNPTYKPKAFTPSDKAGNVNSKGAVTYDPNKTASQYRSAFDKNGKPKSVGSDSKPSTGATKAPSSKPSSGVKPPSSGSSKKPSTGSGSSGSNKKPSTSSGGSKKSSSSSGGSSKRK